jgi:hypothetical protein
MANATIAELIAAVRGAVTKISDAQARKMIKDNNIRSVSKAEAVAAEYHGKTKDELEAAFGPAGEDKPAPAAKKVARKGASTRRTATVVTAGPRGFRFGEVWNDSVKAGEGVAMAPANINKLYAHADSLGISYDKRSVDAAALAKQIARKL